MVRVPLVAAVAALLLVAFPAPAPAGEDVVGYTVEADFDEVEFAIESAIVDRGLVIDYVSRVGGMLNRTAADVGATRQIYTQANVYLFCSATLSRKMMEADPDNIGHCPYGIFAYELAEAPGVIHVGYRRMPEGVMKEVEALLDAIAREAAGLD